MAKFGTEYFENNPENKVNSLEQVFAEVPKKVSHQLRENVTHISRQELIKRVFENKSKSIVDKEKIKLFSEGDEVTTKGIYTPYEFLHELLPKVYATANGFNRYIVSDDEADKINEELEKEKEQLQTEIEEILEENGADSIYELDSEEIDRINNKRRNLESKEIFISESELEAYVLTNPQLNQDDYLTEIKHTIPELLDKGLICFDWNQGEPKFVYKYQYISGNLYTKKSELASNREAILQKISKEQWDYQDKLLNEAMPVKARITTSKSHSIYLNAYSHFCNDKNLFALSSDDFVDWEGGIYGTSTIADAFKEWLSWAEGQGIILPKMYAGFSLREIKRVYVDGEAPSVPDYITDRQTGQTRKLNKKEKEKAEANAKEKAQKVGQPLFDLFLNKALNPDAKLKLEIDWNRKFNSFVLPIMHKTPIALTLGRYFKNNVPFIPNPTQIQSVQFMINAKSGLLAYGVGVGKTASSILNVSYALDNNLCSKPLFVVPLPTYEKWKLEIQGGLVTKYTVSYEENGEAKEQVFSENKKARRFANKNGGKIKKSEYYSKGLLPHLPSIVDLGNLNWEEFVKDNLKTYSKEDEEKIDKFDEGLDFVKGLKDKYKYYENRVSPEGGVPQWEGFDEADEIVEYFPFFEASEFNSTYQTYQHLFLPNVKGFVKAGKKKKKSPIELLLYGYSDSKEGIEINGLRDYINRYKYELGEYKNFPEKTIFIMTYQALKYIGTEKRTEENTYELQNRNSLYSKIYEELSQGEDLETVLSRKPDKLSGLIQDELFGTVTNPKLYLNELGVDYLVVDESHFFKKAFLTAKGRPKQYADTSRKTGLIERGNKKYPTIGSSGYPSSRSLLMYILTRFIQDKEVRKSNDVRDIGGNVCHLTATPFTNSPIEVYSMMALTNIDFLKHAGLFYIEDFFDAFMRIEFAMRFRANQIKKEQVLTGYNNTPQMRRIIYYLMDYKSGSDANIKRPDKYILPSAELGIDTIIAPTDEQKVLFKDLKSYIRGKVTLEDVCGISKMDVSVDEMSDQDLIDYILSDGTEAQIEKFSDIDEMTETLRKEAEGIVSKIIEKEPEIQEEDLDKTEKAIYRFYKGMSFIRQVTLSPYLLQCRKSQGTEPTYREYVESSPKILYSLKSIKTTHDFEDSKNIKRTGIVIYMNMGVDPSAQVPVGEPIGKTKDGQPIYGEFKKVKWNSGGFDKIKQYLVNVMGYSESEVVIVKGGMSNADKENSKNKFLSGKATVLIGSSTISTGVDLQNNASSLFLCAFDWNPTDNEQISGRIHRQGNCRNSVRIVYPMISDSVDPLIFQLLQEKTARINEVWDKEGSKSTLNLEDFNPAELQAQLIKDPDDRVEMWYEKQVDKLNDDITETEQKISNLRLSYETFDTFQTYIPIIRGLLTVIDAYKKYSTQQEGISNVREKIQEISMQTFTDIKDENGKVTQTADEQMVKAINKAKKDAYDYANDPEDRYVPKDYSDVDVDELAKKFRYECVGSTSWYERISIDEIDKINAFAKERYSDWTEGNWISVEEQEELTAKKQEAEQEQLTASNELEVSREVLERLRTEEREVENADELRDVREQILKINEKIKTLEQVYAIKKDVVDTADKRLKNLVNGIQLQFNKGWQSLISRTLANKWVGAWRDTKQKMKILQSWGLNADNIPQARTELTLELSELNDRKDNLDREKETKYEEFKAEYEAMQEEYPSIDEMVEQFASVNERFLGEKARLECFDSDKTPTVAEMPVKEVEEAVIVEEEVETQEPKEENKIDLYYEVIEGYDVLLEIEEDEDKIDSIYDEIEGYLILLEIEGEDVSELRKEYEL